MRVLFNVVLLIAFLFNNVAVPSSFAQELTLPPAGVRINLSPEFIPAHLSGLIIHPDNALKLDFLIDRGDQTLSEDQKKEEYAKLVKYFLASLTIPDEHQWVNLSPYEKNRIIKEDFGLTEMGRDLLAQDYLLKQITSSLIYPEEGLGKKFWDRVYERAQAEFNTSQVPVNTFNKVWIIPDEAAVYEDGNGVFVLQNHLKVMLEEDYLAKKSNKVTPANGSAALGSAIIREIILPELEREVNEGKNFANLRQIYSSMILATWYKRALKESLLTKVYADKAKTKGIDHNNPKVNEEIYQQYLQGLKKGVFNYIREDIDRLTQQPISRKYFSGGIVKGYEGSAIARYSTQNAPPANLAMTSASKFDRMDMASVALSENRFSRLIKKSALAMALALGLSQTQAQSPMFDAIYQADQMIYGNNMSLMEAHQKLKINLDQIFNKLKARDGKVVPDELRAPHLNRVAGSAATYQEFTSAVHQEFDALYARYLAKTMTPQEMQQLADFQNEILRWVYLFWFTNVEYDFEGVKAQRNYADLKNAIEGNPNMPNKERTFVCASSCMLTMNTLFDVGFSPRQEDFSIVRVKTNFKGIPMDGAGHVAVRIKTVDGKKRFLDLTQGYLPKQGIYWPNVDDGVAHKVIAVPDKNGKEIDIDVEVVNAPDIPGLSLADLLEWQKARAQLEDLYKREHSSIANTVENRLKVEDLLDEVKAFKEKKSAMHSIMLSSPLADIIASLENSIKLTLQILDQSNGNKSPDYDLIRMVHTAQKELEAQLKKAKLFSDEEKYAESMAEFKSLMANAQKNLKKAQDAGVEKITGSLSGRQMIDELKNFIKAADQGYALAEQGILNPLIKRGFAMMRDLQKQLDGANKYYKDGFYKEAQEGYEALIASAEGKIRSAIDAGILNVKTSSYETRDGNIIDGQWVIKELKDFDAIARENLVLAQEMVQKNTIVDKVNHFSDRLEAANQLLNAEKEAQAIEAYNGLEQEVNAFIQSNENANAKLKTKAEGILRLIVRNREIAKRNLALVNDAESFNQRMNEANRLFNNAVFDQAREKYQGILNDIRALPLKRQEQFKSFIEAIEQNLRNTQDPAMKGGIDLNSNQLTLHIKRNGAGVPLPWAEQDIERLNQIEGFVPEIVSVEPAGEALILQALRQHMAL